MIGSRSTRPAAPAPFVAVRRRADRWRERFARFGEVLLAPRVGIELFGGDEARRIHAAFCAPHPRYRVFPAKHWGVALLALPETSEAYLAGGHMTLVRRKRRRAAANGFRYAVVPAEEHLDEILEINRSTPERQGRVMDDGYLDPDAVARTFAGGRAIHAVLDRHGRERAYAFTPMAGDVVVLSVLLGHADDLTHGVMYLLVSETVRAWIAARDALGYPRWVMYDTFWGASRGLAEFKTHLGFRPYTVDWAWVAAPVPRRSVWA